MQALANNRFSKQIFAIIMILIISFSALGAPSAFAATEINDDAYMQKLEDKAKEENIFIENFSKLILSIIKPVKVASLSNQVFGNPYEVWWKAESGDKLRPDGIFYEKEWNNIIQPIMGIFMGTYFIIMVLAIMTETLRYNVNVISNRDKSSFWETVHIYAFSAIFVGSFPILLNVMFGLNTAIIDAMERFGESQDAIVAGCFMCGGESQSAIGFLGFLLLFLVEFGVALFIGVLYIARKLIILMLIILIPVVAISLLFPKTRGFFGVWIKELAGNIFLPSIHSVILISFGLMANMDTASFGLKLAMLLLFVPVSGMVQNWMNLGDGSTKMGKSLTMMGAAGLGGAMMLTGMMRNMKGGSGNGGGGFTGNNGTGSTTPSNDHSDANMTGIGARATGALSPKWQGFKNAVSTAGSVAGGLIGAPMGLSPVGAVVGGKIAGGGVQLARQGLLGGAGALAKTIPLMKPGTWKNLESRREAFGNLGESMGSMFGQTGASYGRGVGQMMSGVRQNDVLAARAKDLGVAQDLSSLQEKYAGQDVMFKQTSQGSWFENNQGQRIGAMGAADPNLHPNQVRSVPFRFRGHDEIVKPGIGGSATIQKANMGPFQAGTPEAKIMQASGSMPAGSTPTGNMASMSSERAVGSGSFDLIRTGEASISSNGGGSATMDTNYNAGNIQTENYFAHGSGDHQRLNTPIPEKISNSGAAVVPGAVYKGVGKTAKAANQLGQQTYAKVSNAGANTMKQANAWVNNYRQRNRM
ncbi:hypothetical protein [Niallia taxi]|uniref:hypothetical protein n=1 Tax=Niallia taxi TaxID=2499688 RepID=UPI0015F5C7CF|nr:hypothetical protein [Niallia taxi]